METFHSASALIAARKPEKPIIGLRPHAAGRAARWFLANFPGDIAYAYKANSSGTSVEMMPDEGETAGSVA